uniref:Fatty acyl-CoA reductase C-terminal domain-containing protein n=1 Tax=Oryza brachyantha TaxID=4533 RepID=J3MV95_ORYBR
MQKPQGVPPCLHCLRGRRPGGFDPGEGVRGRMGAAGGDVPGRGGGAAAGRRRAPPGGRRRQGAEEGHEGARARQGAPLRLVQHLRLHQGHGRDGALQDAARRRGRRRRRRRGGGAAQHHHQRPARPGARVDAGHAHHRHAHHRVREAEPALLPRRPGPGDGRDPGGHGGERDDGGDGGALRRAGQEGRPAVYHVSSSLRNPAAYWVLYEAGRRHFTEKPRTGKRGEVIPTKEMHFFKTIASFQLYMLLKYRLPLELLHLLNLLLCGLFSRLYSDLATKYRYVMHLVDVYGPFAFFKGCFDDINLERLRQRMGRSNSTEDDDMFNFDPKTIDWEDYFYRIHIPGVLKYILK